MFQRQGLNCFCLEFWVSSWKCYADNEMMLCKNKLLNEDCSSQSPIKAVSRAGTLHDRHAFNSWWSVAQMHCWLSRGFITCSHKDIYLCVCFAICLLCNTRKCISVLKCRKLARWDFASCRWLCQGIDCTGASGSAKVAHVQPCLAELQHWVWANCSWITGQTIGFDENCNLDLF